MLDSARWLDTWATVDHVRRFGKNVHLSGGAWSKGLESFRASTAAPVIIEDGGNSIWLPAHYCRRVFESASKR